MVTIANTPTRALELPKPELKRSTTNVLGWGALVAILMWSWDGADMRPMELIRDSDNMVQYLLGFFPPNFTEWEIYVQEMLITIQLAVWGTVLAVVCSVPCGILSA